MKFRKKPVVIDAVRSNMYNWDDLKEFAGDKIRRGMTHGSMTLSFFVSSLEGEMMANHGDWIIKGVNGEFYSCRNDIFIKTYEVIG